MSKKKIFRTYETMVMEKLQKIEPASMQQLTKALNMKHSPYSIMKSLLKKKLIIRNYDTFPNTYTVKNKVVIYD